MIYRLITQFWMLLLDLVAVVGRSEQQQEFELLLLRQQLRILHRHHRRADATFAIRHRERSRTGAGEWVPAVCDHSVPLQ